MNRKKNMKDPKMENSIYMDLALIQSNKKKKKQSYFIVPI